MFKDDDLPHWVSAAFASPVFGCMMLALGVCLAALAWRSLANTRILAGTFAVFALAFALNVVEVRGILGPDPERDESMRHNAANHFALQAPQLVAGLTLPAGTVVRWKTDDHKNAEVEMPGLALVNGIPLIGKFTLDEFFWTGDLAEDHAIDGWPCAAGKIYIGVDGHLQQCTLAGARSMPKLTVPAGSHIETQVNNQNEQPFAETKITLKTDTVNATDGVVLPAGAYLTLYGNGAIEQAEAPEAPMQVRGLALGSYAFWRYGRKEPGAPPDGTPTQYVKGRLKVDVQCADRKIPAETWVSIPPKGSALLVADKDDSVDPSPIEGCFHGR